MDEKQKPEERVEDLEDLELKDEDAENVKGGGFSIGSQQVGTGGTKASPMDPLIRQGMETQHNEILVCI